MIVPSHEATTFYSEVKWIWIHVSFKIANSLYHISFSDLTVSEPNGCGLKLEEKYSRKYIVRK
uniref:Uncharacterized protein n=1 Tax=Physcomitrium patens TaxID=3218 RepID=A0A2K1IQM0_PHYPA|nr:hypothetical protein PHYPA_025694 [Physcomitrium patens]